MDRAPSTKTRSPLAEVEEVKAEEEEEDSTAVNPPAAVSRPPVSNPPRIHKDSGREIMELEPIDEQSERLESSSSVDTSEPVSPDASIKKVDE